jgi:hypothetical protein
MTSQCVWPLRADTDYRELTISDIMRTSDLC